MANRAAIRAVWGEEGVAAVAAHLREEPRRILLDESLSPVAWVPETHLVALAEAIFAGPARADEPTYLRFVDHTLDMGFGRVRRLFVRFAPPELLFSRAPALWRHDHSHGELGVTVGERRASVRLDHGIHLESAIAAATAAESFRYALALTRARDVTETHAIDDGILRVELAWR